MVLLMSNILSIRNTLVIDNVNSPGFPLVLNSENISNIAIITLILLIVIILSITSIMKYAEYKIFKER